MHAYSPIIQHLIQMNYLYTILSCFALLLSSYTLHASHIAAADISYECLGNNNYEFTLRLYRDCRGIPITPRYTIQIQGIGACSNISIPTSIPKVSEIELPVLCSDPNIPRSCGFNGTSLGLGYEEIIYKGRVNLAQLNGCNWQVSWATCCRNNAITTANPATSTYVYASFIDSSIVCNNSPTFNNTPVFIVCDSNLQEISNAMIDLDGDSLVYSLVNPLDAYNTFVPYNAGFSATQPLTTTPAGFQFNPSSGQMTFTPSGTQVTITDVLVQEYRNGQLIGQTQRSIQIAVMNCNNNNSLTLDQVSRQVNGIWQTQGTNTTFDICPGEVLNFKLELSDVDANDTLALNAAYSSLLRTYPNATVQSYHGAATNQLTIEVSIPIVQVGTFTLGVNDNACPAVDLQTFGIDLVPRANCARLTGRIFMDDNNNCLADPTELTVPQAPIYINKGNSPIRVHIDGQGYFSMLVDTGTYQISVQTPSTLVQLCPTVQSFTLSNLSSSINVDLPLQTTAWCPALEVNIGANALIHCRPSTYQVSYCNNGNQTAYNARVEVTLDSLFVINSSTLPILSQNNYTYTFDLDSIPVGICGNFSITGVLDTACDFSLRGRTHCARAHIFPDTICGSWTGALLQVEGRCQNDSVSFRMHNTGQQAMSAPQRPLIIMDNLILTTGTPIQLAANASSPWMHFPATGATYRAEIDQEPFYPWGLSAAAIVEGCQDTTLSSAPVSTGMVNIFSLDEGLPYIGLDCQPNVGSYDPNDKQAFPIGHQSPHYIRANEDLKYRIRFQNTGTYNAQFITLVDTLSPYLDPFSVVPTVASHAYTWRIKEGHILEVYFDHIYLPAAQNDSLGSQGFVDFKIKQQVNNPIGTVINNSAAIYFDLNPPIITNTTFHTIGDNFLQFINLPSVEQGDALTVTAFPNPFSQSTTLRIQDSQHYEQLNVQVFNALGQLVDQTSNQGSEQQIIIQRKKLTPGIYFYRLEGDGKQLHAGQLLVQ